MGPHLEFCGLPNCPSQLAPSLSLVGVGFGHGKPSMGELRSVVSEFSENGLSFFEANDRDPVALSSFLIVGYKCHFLRFI